MEIKQRESSVCVVERRLTQSREGRNGGWTASNLNELMSCGVCRDWQGSPNGFIYSGFSPTFFIHGITYPISFRSWFGGESPCLEGGVAKKCLE